MDNHLNHKNHSSDTTELIRTFASLHILLNAAQEKLNTLMMCRTPPGECDLVIWLNVDFTGSVYNLAESAEIVLFEFESIDELFQKLTQYSNMYS